MPFSVPGFRKLPGFRGPIDLEIWRLERGYGYRGQAEMVALPGRLWCSRARKKERKQLVRRQTQVPDTEGKQVLWIADQLVLDMGSPVVWGLSGA